jgi:hypothetical protein
LQQLSTQHVPSATSDPIHDAQLPMPQTFPLFPLGDPSGDAGGGGAVVEAKDGLLVFDRIAGKQTIRCAFNFATTGTQVEIEMKPEVLWAADAVFVGGKLMMEPHSAAILRLV